MKRFSLTWRIIGTVIACQLLLTTALTIAAVLYGRAQLRSAFDTALQGRAMSTLALVRYTESSPPGLLFDAKLVPPSPKRHPDVFEIRTEDGQLVARSGRNLPDSSLKWNGSYAEFKLAGVPYRSILLAGVNVLDDEGDTNVTPVKVNVIYAASAGRMQERLIQLGAWVAGTSLLLLAIASLATAWAIRRGLEPLRELAASAGNISVHNWEFRPPPKAAMTRELAPLTAAIETVLDGLKDAFRQQRDFTSDAAHELKTSVAILKSTLQSLLQRPRPEEEYRRGLADSLKDCERLEDLLQRMLRLARIEQWAETGMPRNLSTTELISTCEAAISRIGALANSRNISIDLVDPAPIHLRANPEDLELVWVNLLENAVQYSPPGSRVAIHVERNGGNTAQVWIEDAGPGIPAAELPHVFERFRRGEPSRARSTGGFGLGLAICKAMVVAYGGDIEAYNADGHGTKVLVQLPVEPVA